MAKKRRGSQRSRLSKRPPTTAERLRTRVRALSQDDARKRRLSLGLAAVSAAVLLILGLLGWETAIYVLVLASVSLGLVLWALPDALLALTAVFLFTQPLLVFLGNSSFNVTKLAYSIVMIAVLALVWMGRMLARGDREIRLTALVWPGLGILGAALLSLLNSEHLGADVLHVRTLVVFGGFVLILANTVRDGQGLRLLVGALLIAGGLAAAYGLAQYLGVTLAAIAGDAPSGAAATVATFGNQNYLGGFLAVLYGPGLALLLVSRSTSVRVAVIAGLALIYTTFVAIGSDSTWLAWLVAMAVLASGVILTRRWRPVVQQWPWLAALVASTLVAAVAFQLAAAWMGPTSDAAPGETGQEIDVSASTPFFSLARRFAEDPVRFLQETRTFQQRLEFWLISWEMFQDAPIVGIGIGDFKREFLDYKAAFHQTPLGRSFEQRIGYLRRAEQAHNEYIQVGAEMGIVGLIALFAVLGVLIVRGVQRVRQATATEGASADAPMFGVSLLAGLAALLSDSMFSFPLHLPPNALAGTLLLGLLFSPALGAPRVAIRLSPRGIRVAAVTTLVVALTVSGVAYREWLSDVYFTSGRALADAGRSEAAEQVLQAGAGLSIAPGKISYELGSLHAWEGNASRALEHLRASRPIFTTEYTFYLLGLANVYRGDFASAQRHVEHLLAMDPHPELEPEARYMRAFALMRQGRPGEAIPIFQDLLDQGYDPQKVHVNLGEAYIQRGDPGQARTHLHTAIDRIDEALNADQADQVSAFEGLSQAALESAAERRRGNLRRLKDRAEQLLEQLPAGN